MSESKKQQIIRDIYFDKAGYGSRKTTLEDAKKKEPTIKKEDVEQFFRKNVEIKAKPRGHNSFVAPHNNHTYQIDLFFMGYYDFDEEQKYRGGLVCIDVLSKYAVVIPIVSKNEPDVIEATKEALKRMGKKPKIIYSDDEKAIAGGDFKDYIEGENIELYRTRGHPAFAERFIRTYKDMLFKRVEADEKKGKQNIDWTDYIFQIMITYNNKNIHSSTQMTPKEARLKRNEYAVKLNLELRALKNRTYPELNVGDEVKVMRKKAITEKERSSRYLADTFKVTRIEEKLGQKYYYLEGRPRPHLRYELLKV